MLFIWLIWNRGSWFKFERGLESRRLYCLIMDYEYELVINNKGVGESSRVEWKSKM